MPEPVPAQVSERPIRELGQWSELGAAEREQLLGRGLERIFDPALRDSVAQLVEDVRRNGDDAVVRALKQFDGCDVAPDQLRVSDHEFAAALAAVSDRLRDAIRDAIDHVRRFNQRLTAQGSWSFESEPGLIVGEKISPIVSAGLFVPSGKASYPSVLVQLGTPAVVAGVPQIAVVVPPVPGSGGKVDDAVLVAAHELGIREVFRANGPAGVAALAFGTESFPKVRKVLGPGSPPVACAQLEVQRDGCATQLLLGPSESLVLADASADPRLLAADLLNEAEHGSDSASVLVTDSRELLAAAQREVARQLAALPAQRRAYASAALGANGGAVLVHDLDEGVEVANEYAPEHMMVVVRNDAVDRVLGALHNAGEILVGQWTPVSAANFLIGCPAALPTGGFAKVSGGVTADTFRKRTAIAHADRDALQRMSGSILAFTAHEGFPAHEAAILVRLDPALSP